MINRNIFEDLFFLDMANNHLGSVERGLKIIREFSHVVRFNNVRASIMLQFRDGENFIDKDLLNLEDLGHVKKTLGTRLTDDECAILVKAIRQAGCIATATLFDERSVDLCVKLGLPILKIANSNVNNWFLLEKIAKTKKPVLVSKGGSSLRDMDDIVMFFANQNIPLAINHSVSTYPAEDSDLDINQIDLLRQRYPNNTIGYSANEYTNSTYSMMIAYAKGARTFERRIDIDSDGAKVSPYCSLPSKVDEWFKAFQKAKSMCGAPGTQMRMPSKKELEFLGGLARGVYAKEDFPEEHSLTVDDVYLAIPLQKGQLSCRELMSGEKLVKAVKKDQAIHINDIESPYAQAPSLRKTIYNRDLDES